MWRYAAVNILIACDQVEAGWPLWWEVCFEGDTTNPSTPNCLAPTWVQPEYYKMKWVWQWNFYSLLNVYVSFNMIIIQTLLYNNNCVCVTLCTPHLPTWISLWWTQAMQSDLTLPTTPFSTRQAAVLFITYCIITLVALDCEF